MSGEKARVINRAWEQWPYIAPETVAEVVATGWNAGRASRDAEVERLRGERDESARREEFYVQQKGKADTHGRNQRTRAVAAEAARDEARLREVTALRRTWSAFGCERNPDDHRPAVRDAMWGQIETFARDAENADRRVVREAREAHARAEAAELDVAQMVGPGVLANAEAERDAAVHEMHARELHHFESEVALEAAEAKIAAALAVTPFRFADADDPERTLGDPVLWQSEVLAALTTTGQAATTPEETR